MPRVRSMPRLFALSAVALMLAATMVPSASAQVLEDEAGRAQRLGDAVDGLMAGGPTPEALAEARAAMADAPPALRTSPLMRDLEEAIALLETPFAARLLAPLLKEDALDDPAAILARAQGQEAALADVQARLGLDPEVLKDDWDALKAASEGFDLTGEEAFRASLQRRSDDELRAFMLQLGAFMRRWNETSGTEVAASLDATMTEILRHDPQELRADLAADAALSARYREAVALLEDVQSRLLPDETLAEPASPLSPEDQAAWDAYVATVRANAASIAGLDQDPFLALPQASEYPYDLGAGPVAVDGQPVDGAALPEAPSPLDLDALWGPLDPALDEDAPLAPLGRPPQLESAREAALRLDLPGARPGLPSLAMDSALEEDAEWGETGETMHEGAWVAFLEPGHRGVLGTVGAGDARDVYRFNLTHDKYVRIFLQVAEHNADLEVYCDEDAGVAYDNAPAGDLPTNGRRWSSRSSAEGGIPSARPYFDSVTFVHNKGTTYGQTQDPAFLHYDEWACKSGSFVVVVDAPAVDAPETTYYLHGVAVVYDGRPCPAMEVGFDSLCGMSTSECRDQGVPCGLVNWARWGDRCKLEPRYGAACRLRHEFVPGADGVVRAAKGRGNHGEYDREWFELVYAKADNPVVFIHGVGGSYAHMVDMEGDGFYQLFNEKGNKFIKEIIGSIASSAVMIATALHTYKAFNAVLVGAASGSLLGAFAGLAIFSNEMNAWANAVSFILRTAKDVTRNWRAGSHDVESHFWAMRDAGFETYWFEYNFNDNNARHGQIKAGSRELKWGLSAIQQDFYDRHKDDFAFPYGSPEDVRVDLVVHSMGGLVSRLYTTDQTLLREGVTYSSPVYEGDVNKWISIQTPNMGSSVARYGVSGLQDTIETALVGSALEAAWDSATEEALSFTSVWLLVSKMINEMLKQFFKNFLGKLAAGAIAGHVADDLYATRPELIRGNPLSIVTTTINTAQPAPDVDHGIIYGVPIQARVIGLGRIDLLVASVDAKGPPQLLDRMAAWPVKEDHASALFADSVQRILLDWLRNPDPFRLNALPTPEDIPGVANGGGASGPTSAAAALAAEATGHSLLADFGQRPDADAWTEKLGAVYLPDGEATQAPAPILRADPAPLGDRTARLERLGATRNVSGAADLYAGVAAFARESAALAVTNGSQDAYNDSLAAGAALMRASVADRGTLARAEDRVPDVGILRSGHFQDAGALLEGRLGEPYALIDLNAPLSEFQKRTLVVVPTGALAGLSGSAFLPETLARYVEGGGTLLVLAQQRGTDLRLVPGAPEGFGYAEEDAAYRGAAVVAGYTPALAEVSLRPDAHVDGSFTKLPDGAQTLLAHARNGRPVLATWAVGAGRVVAAQVPADWAAGTGVATQDDLRLVRGLLADHRAPATPRLAAPREALTLGVTLPETNATNVTLVLVDAGARELARETFQPDATLTWTLAPNATRAGQHAVDAVLRFEDGTTSRRHDVLRFHTATLDAGANGFREAGAAALLDVTSATDRVEQGRPLDFAVHVTNRGPGTATFTLGGWFPAHAAAYPDGSYGQAPALNASPAAWSDNFRLTRTVEVAPNATATETFTLPAAQRADAFALRLQDAQGATLAEARRGFATYVPSVLVEAAPGRAAYGAGQDARLQVSWRDAGAASTSETTSLTLHATLRDPHGIIAAVASQPVLANGQTRFANLTLPLPADALPGAYVATVEARRGAERVGAGGATFRVTGVNLAVSADLPAAFEADVPASVTYSVRNAGTRDVPAATLSVRLVAPDGQVEWTGSAPLGLPAGAEARPTFSVMPATVKLGRYELVHEIAAGDATIEGVTPVLSSVSARVGFSKPSYRVGDALQADARLVNDGRFVLPLDATLATDAVLPDAAASLRLAPGASHVLTLAGTLPDDLQAGARPVTLTLATPDASRTLARSFTVPAARVAIPLPAVSSHAAGDALGVTLANAGGIHARVPWSAQLLDARGHDVLGASGSVLVLAGGSVALPLAVPAQAANGTYDLRVLAETTPGRPSVARASVQVAGVAAALDLAAPTSAAPLAAVGLSATPTGVGPAALADATLTLEALRPVPLPAWTRVDGVRNATSALRHDGASWFGTTEGVLRVADDGAATRFTVADGLPSDHVTELAVARGLLHVGTDRGLAWRGPDGTWASAATLGELPTRHVRSLAGTSAALFVGTEAGVVRLDGAGFEPVPLPAQAVADLAADEAELWVALADVQGGFTGDDFQPVTRGGTLRPAPAVAVAPDGDVHLAYVDNDTQTQSVLHVRLSARGERLAGPSVVSQGIGTRGEPAIAIDRAGGVHVAWHDGRDGDHDVYYRKLTREGAPLTPETPVGVHRGSQQQFVRVAIDSRERVHLVWQDSRNPNPPGNFVSKGDEIHGAVLARDGSVLVPDRRMTDSVGYVLRPQIAFDAQDNLHAVWTDVVKQCIDNDPDACYPELESFYGKWASDGSVLVDRKLVSRSDQSMSWMPTLGVLPTGEALVAYEDASFGRTELALSRVDAAGNVLSRGVRFTHEGASPKNAQLLARPDGRMDLVWTDWRAGRAEAWHQVVEPLTLQPAGNATRVSGAPEGMATGLVARNPRLAHAPTGALYAVWDDHRVAGKPEVRMAVFEAKLLGRGLARVDLANGETTRFRAADGLLPSDDVSAVALDATLVAATTPEGLLLRERAGGASFTVPLEGALALAVHQGRAFVATPTGIEEIDAATGGRVRLDPGAPPAPAALAGVPGGVLVAGPSGAAVHADDRADRVWTAALAATDGQAVTASFQAPAETGRVILRATLHAATGQTLAAAQQDLFVTEGALTLTVKPPATPARPGETVPVRVTAANAGTQALKGVDVRLLVGGVPTLSEVVSLAPGEARTFLADVRADASLPLRAEARGAPADLAGLAASAEAAVGDWLAVEPPAVSARILAPAVAGREPVQVDAVLTNRGLLAQRLLVSLNGGAPVPVELPALGRATLSNLSTVTVLHDADLVLDVRGDSELAATHRILAGEKVGLLDAAPLAGPTGERILTLRLRNAGPLASALSLGLALDGAPLDPVAATVPGLGETGVDLAISLAPGVHVLDVTTPWETRSLRLVASDRALPLLRFDDVRVAGGNATPTVRVENAGPGRLVGTLDVDLGFRVLTWPVSLAEGASVAFSDVVPLAGIPSGAAQARATFLRDGAEAASATRAFDVPAPAFRFVASPGARQADAGETLELSYTVENVGQAAGSVEVAFTLGGSDAQARRVTLAPGERATLVFPTRVEPDARDGPLVARAALPDAEATSLVQVRGARVLARATTDAPAYAPGATGALLVSAGNPSDRPLDLVARARLGDQETRAPFTLAPGGNATVPLALVVNADDEARWSVALASGRVLAEGGARFALSPGPAQPVLVELDRGSYGAGENVTVTVTTGREGRVDLLGPGFRDAFVLNGTTARTYALPSAVPTGRYAVHWSFDGADASGSVGVGIVGQEVRSVAFAQDADGPLRPGDALAVEWRVRANRAMDLVLSAWFEDPQGNAAGGQRLTTSLVPGDNVLRFGATVPPLEPGELRLNAALLLGDLELASDGANLALRGVALREAAIDDADGVPTLVLETRGESGDPLTFTLELAGEEILRETRAGADHARRVPLALPEPGAYDLRVTVQVGGLAMTRDLVVPLAGVGTPPVSAHAVEGARLQRDDGVLVLAPQHRLRFTADDGNGAGVADLDVRDDGVRIPAEGPMTLAPGLHNLTYAAVDKAGNRETPHRLVVLVDAQAPRLVLAQPAPGQVHVGGDLVLDAPQAPGAEPPAWSSGIPRELWDRDLDGHPDAQEDLEGSDPDDPDSVPAYWTPAPPLPSERPIVAVGALRVRTQAPDDETGAATVRVLLDGRLVGTAGAEPADVLVDLSGEAPGDHLLTVTAEDALGNVATRAVRLVVVPAGPDGLARFDPTDPRLPPSARLLVAWAQGLPVQLQDVLAADAARRQERAQQEVDAAAELVMPYVPPAVTELPGHVERELALVQQAIEDLRDCGCLVP